MINNGWETASLSEIARIRTGKLDSNAATSGGRFPFFTCSPDTLTIDTFAFDDEAVLLAGNNANGVFCVKHYCGKFNAYQRTYVITSKDTSVLSTQYLYYQLRLLAGGLGAVSIGSATKFLTLKILEPLTIPLPKIQQQRAIAAVLGSLDAKIEQNRRMGAKLEGLARAVFKAWFVDFEPVKAKAAGATAFPGMPPETFAALPTGFVDSSLGPVPQGWESCCHRVSELELAGTLLIGDGYRAKRSELAETGVPFIRAGNVNGTIITDGAELLGKPAIEKAGVKRSQTWDTVFTSKGTVGRIGLMTPTTGDVVYAPQVCFWRAINRDALSPFLLHLWMKSESFTAQWMSVKGQTDMADFVSLSDQRAMSMLVPPPELQRGFDNVVRPIVELIAATGAESAKLATLRDYLLPRLLSGKVRAGLAILSQSPASPE